MTRCPGCRDERDAPPGLEYCPSCGKVTHREQVTSDTASNIPRMHTDDEPEQEADVPITLPRPKRTPFKQRTRCPKCDQARRGTLVTKAGTPILHEYDCGTTLENTGVLTQSKRCKKRQEREKRLRQGATTR